MNSRFFMSSTVFILVIIIIFSFITTVQDFVNANILSISNSNTFYSDNLLSFNYSSAIFVWPTPKYTTITSYFGYRNAPTYGASTYHSGIDIGAPMRK